MRGPFGRSLVARSFIARSLVARSLVARRSLIVELRSPSFGRRRRASIVDRKIADRQIADLTIADRQIATSRQRDLRSAPRIRDATSGGSIGMTSSGSADATSGIATLPSTVRSRAVRHVRGSEECKLAATGHFDCFGRSRSRSPLLQKKVRSRKAGASGQLAGELKGPGRWCPLTAYGLGLAIAWQRHWPVFFLDWPLITSIVHKKIPMPSVITLEGHLSAKRDVCFFHRNRADYGSMTGGGAIAPSLTCASPLGGLLTGTMRPVES